MIVTDWMPNSPTTRAFCTVLVKLINRHPNRRGTIDTKHKNTRLQVIDDAIPVMDFNGFIVGWDRP